MAKEKCPHCNKKKPDLAGIQISVAGNTLMIRVCDKCRSSLETITAFASAFPTSTRAGAAPYSARSAPARRGRSPKKAAVEDKKFATYALSQEEIAKTQALRPTVRYQDSPRKRDLDNIDKLNSGERVSVFCYGSGRLAGGRNKKIMREAQGKLGTDSIKCIKDDGFEAVFEAA